MVREKIFKCSCEKPDEVVLELAKEIEAGWHIGNIEQLDLTLSMRTRLEPRVAIHLIKKEI